jgi:hypothetical protein
MAGSRSKTEHQGVVDEAKEEKKRGRTPICGLVEVLKDAGPPAGHPTSGGAPNRRQQRRPPSGGGGRGSRGQVAVGGWQP